MARRRSSDKPPRLEPDMRFDVSEPDDSPAQWLCDVAWRVRRLIDDYAAVERFRAMVRTWAARAAQWYEANPYYASPPPGTYGPPPLKLGVEQALPIDAKYTALAAVHDHCLWEVRHRAGENVPPVHPWHGRPIVVHARVDKLGWHYSATIRAVKDLEEGRNSLVRWLREVRDDLRSQAKPGPEQAEIVSLGGGSYQATGGEPVAVSDAEDAILQAFLKYGPAMDAPTMADKANVAHARDVLRRLCKKYDRAFAGAIRLPGGKAKGGYMVRIRGKE